MISGLSADTKSMDQAAGRTRTNVIAIPRLRASSEQAQIQADDQLIEDLRAGRITDTSREHPVVRLLARWRQSLLAVSGSAGTPAPR
jgi:hypothetical protein